MRPTAAKLAATLGLEPHPEGGFFRETYRSPDLVQTAAGARPACTAILFLVAAGAVSRLHRLSGLRLRRLRVGLARRAHGRVPPPRRPHRGFDLSPRRLTATGRRGGG